VAVPQPEPLQPVAWSAKPGMGFNGEMLSVAVDDEHHVAAVTNPGSGAVIFLDTRDGALLGRVGSQTGNIAFDATRKKFVCGGQGVEWVAPAREQESISVGGKEISFDSSHCLLI